MININLLPPEYGPKKLININNLAIIGIFFLITLSVLFSSFRLLITIQSYSERVDYYDMQIKNYRQQVEDIRELGMKIKLLKVRLSLVQELLKDKAIWSDRLNDLYQCLPGDGLWIDKVVVEYQKPEVQTVASKPPESESEKKPDNEKIKSEPIEKPPVLFEITGTATSIDKISQFVSNLEYSRTFGNIVFRSTIKGLQAKAIPGPLMTFNFTMQVLEPLVES